MASLAPSWEAITAAKNSWPGAGRRWRAGGRMQVRKYSQRPALYEVGLINRKCGCQSLAEPLQSLWRRCRGAAAPPARNTAGKLPAPPQSAAGAGLSVRLPQTQRPDRPTCASTLPVLSTSRAAKRDDSSASDMPGAAWGGWRGGGWGRRSGSERVGIGVCASSVFVRFWCAYLCAW
jgi:hypothetical protein